MLIAVIRAVCVVVAAAGDFVVRVNRTGLACIGIIVPFGAPIVVLIAG